jgi:hypothetical protein
MVIMAVRRISLLAMRWADKHIMTNATLIDRLIPSRVNPFSPRINSIVEILSPLSFSSSSSGIETDDLV